MFRKHVSAKKNANYVCIFFVVALFQHVFNIRVCMNGQRDFLYSSIRSVQSITITNVHVPLLIGSFSFTTDEYSMQFFD